jgi:hypothetical protein
VLPHDLHTFLPRPAAKNPTPRREAGEYHSLRIRIQVVGRCPTPQKIFEKSLIKNFTKVIFNLFCALTFALSKPGVRCAGQDDDPHSGSRGIFVRVKPDKHSPVLRDEKKLPELLLGANRRILFPPLRGGFFVGDGVPDVPRPQSDRLQPSYRQAIAKRNKTTNTTQDTAKQNLTNRTII